MSGNARTQSGEGGSAAKKAKKRRTQINERERNESNRIVSINRSGDLRFALQGAQLDHRDVAANAMFLASVGERWIDLFADGAELARTARVKHASGRWRGRARRIADQSDAFLRYGSTTEHWHCR